MSASGEELLQQAVEGNREALSALLERHGPTVRAGLTTAIPQRWQAVLTVDDVMQQTYADAFLDIRRFVPHGTGSFVAWLTTIAKRSW